MPDVAAQLAALVAGVREILGDGLVGLYLHGSLLLGDDAMPAVEAYAAHLRPEIEQASSTLARPTWRAWHTGAGR
ncbi:MAG TPA: hypothetical protein VGQ15_11500 [Gaiellaceae bacterium]|nr:hypothetical protein [Gaiellaceae bacterium]